MRNGQSFNLGTGNNDIDFVIRGPELEKLAEYGNALKARAPELGLQDIDVSLKLDRPELRAEIDRARAADLGIRTADIAASLRLMVGGDEEVTRFRDRAANQDYDVQLRLDERDRGDIAKIERLYVPRSNGELVRLDSVVNLVSDESPSRVDRLDRQRQISAARRHRRRGMRSPIASRRCARPRPSWACPPPTPSASPGAAASWNARSWSSAGRSCCR